jgi:hypothetical protein
MCVSGEDVRQLLNAICLCSLYSDFFANAANVFGSGVMTADESIRRHHYHKQHAAFAPLKYLLVFFHVINNSSHLAQIQPLMSKGRCNTFRRAVQMPTGGVISGR